MDSNLIAREELVEEARRLLDSLGEGSMSETAYDTAWVARVPNPDRPEEPLFPAAFDWLIRNQHPDGSWGAEIPFAHDRVISTLAALLTLSGTSYRRAESEIAARRAIVYLNRERPDLRNDPAETVGFELILPELIRQAQELGLSLPYEDWRFVEALKADKLNRIPPIAVYGGPTPLTHSLEYLGERMASALVTRAQAPNGSYGASPSATAYVQMRQPQEQALRYLREVASLSPGGGVVDVYPINVFETAWVLQSLSPLKSDLPAYDRHVDRLARFWNPQGVSFTDAGMVSDADDTAVALGVLRVSGRPVDTDVLELFEGNEYFFCFPFERNQSIRANAAILEVLQLYESNPDRRRMTLKIVNYLQRASTDGLYWRDKWHVSPFYATARVVSALGGIDNRLTRSSGVWISEQQHENGSWGFENGTVEETACALEALSAAVAADGALAGLLEPSRTRGQAYLAAHFDEDDYPCLWIGKGLYTPFRVVRALVLGTLYRWTISRDLGHQNGS